MNLKENLISDDLVDLVDDIFEIDYSELTDFDPKNFDLGEYFDEESRSNFDSLEPLTTPVPSSTTLKSTTTTISASGELGTRNHGLTVEHLKLIMKISQNLRFPYKNIFFVSCTLIFFKKAFASNFLFIVFAKRLISVKGLMQKVLSFSLILDHI